jgi:hypothetical protein
LVHSGGRIGGGPAKQQQPAATVNLRKWKSRARLVHSGGRIGGGPAKQQQPAATVNRRRLKPELQRCAARPNDPCTMFASHLHRRRVGAKALDTPYAAEQ